MVAPVDKLFTAEDELEFKQTFAVHFLAAYTATRYDDCCSRGLHGELRQLPVEDAKHLAEHAWAEWVKQIGTNAFDPHEAD